MVLQYREKGTETDKDGIRGDGVGRRLIEGICGGDRLCDVYSLKPMSLERDGGLEAVGSM